MIIELTKQQALKLAINQVLFSVSMAFLGISLFSAFFLNFFSFAWLSLMFAFMFEVIAPVVIIKRKEVKK